MLEVAGDDADVRPEVKSVPPVLSPEPERDVFSPTGGVVLAGDRPDERRFPGTVRAEDGDVLSFADRERYGVEERSPARVTVTFLNSMSGGGGG